MSLTLRLLEKCLSFVSGHQYSVLIASLVTLLLYFLTLRRKLKRKIEEIGIKIAEEERERARLPNGTAVEEVETLKRQRMSVAWL